MTANQARRPRTKRKPMSKEYIFECFEYRDGVLYWKERPDHHFSSAHQARTTNKQLAGKRAGSRYSPDGRMCVIVGGQRIGTYVIIFFMHHGYEPECVDHIDGDVTNDRIENLRAATHWQNCQNCKTTPLNTSGRKGVCWKKGANKWAAYIRANKKVKHLGLFTDFAAAVAARKSAEQKYYGEFANER